MTKQAEMRPWTWRWAWRTARHAVFAPVLWAYLKAPRVWGMGGYGGLYAEDACSRLTNSPAAFWQQHPELCQELLETKLEGAAIFLLGVLAGSTLWQACALASRARKRTAKRRGNGSASQASTGDSREAA